MNDLTGAFLYALEKKLDPNFIRQSLSNAGYNSQDIEAAYLEANQIYSLNSKPENLNKKSPSHKYNFLIFLVIFLIFLVGLFVVWYFFLGGKESEILSRLLEKLKLKK